MDEQIVKELAELTLLGINQYSFIYFVQNDRIETIIILTLKIKGILHSKLQK